MLVYMCTYVSARKLVTYILHTISVVEASEFSKASFLEWVRGAVFSPAVGLKIEVDEIEHGTFQPPTCGDCALRWKTSNLGPITAEIKWHLIKEKEMW